MKKCLVVILLSLCPLIAGRAEQVELRPLEGHESTVRQGTSWGVPFDRGSVPSGTVFRLKDAAGQTVPCGSWPLAWWPDGSLKWVGVATVTDRGPLYLDLERPAKAKSRRSTAVTEPLPRSLVEQSSEGVRINTGVMTCLLPSDGDSFLRDIALGGKVIASDASLVAVWERRSSTGPRSTVIQEECLGRIERVSVVQDNPMRAVVKVEGRHHAESGREWLPYAVYCIFYADMPTIQLTHSFVFDSDGEEDFIKGLGVRFSVPFREQVHNRHVRFAGDGRDGAGFWCNPRIPGG